MFMPSFSVKLEDRGSSDVVEDGKISPFFVPLADLLLSSSLDVSFAEVL